MIIGVNEYKPRNNLNLVGAVPDADAMLYYLQEQLGASSQIRDFRNSEATRAAIIGEIKAISLNKKIKEGDPFLIYEGHGGSVDTPKGWGSGRTGEFELLDPYDHSSPLDHGNLEHKFPERTIWHTNVANKTEASKIANDVMDSFGRRDAIVPSSHGKITTMAQE